ncbi:DUF4282 domain-containing protein [Virgibacillus alimentarius]|uniref:DUF4282 domain-containing protein n=1 Tax=Virgibacillus alimentarius TaxID=698769 RepID=A0ABS4S7R2_9BACI|nr:DUF4282 domain-containing protein [Virgibacillus alimentarius]MBP2257454.1 hypothetical protein [Virgibacillus alimentarius]
MEEKFKNFVKFDKMITPTIIKIVFWIGVAFVVIGSVFTIAEGMSYYGDPVNIFMGLLMLVVGPLFVRIYCELLIIMFKMYQTLTEVKTLLSNKNHSNDMNDTTSNE